jgi:hypothetical protein
LVLIGRRPQNPTTPFKFNSSWLKDESFQQPVKSNWTNIRDSDGTPIGTQFVSNLKRIKKLVIPWEKTKQKAEERELQSIEDRLKLIQEESKTGFMTVLARDNLKRLEARHRVLLAEQEETWRLKSKAI